MSSSQDKKSSQKKSSSFSPNNIGSSTRTRKEKDPSYNVQNSNNLFHDVEIDDQDMDDSNDYYDDQIFADDEDAEEDEEMTDGASNHRRVTGEEEDDEDDSLMRLSEQYQRFSRPGGLTEDGGDEEDYEEEDDTDLMRSIHRSNRHSDDGEEEGGEDALEDDEAEEDEDDEAEDDGEADEGDDGVGNHEHDIFHQALAAFTGRRLNQGDNSQPARLDETIGRMFPEALSMFGSGFGGGSQITALIDSLSQREDSYLLLENLNQLSESLLMMNAIVAERSIPANKLSKSLIDIMQDPILVEELELQLVACRCLYNLLEVNPEFSHDAINNGAIEVLCAKLFEISYIDLAEQALQTLEMISRSNFVQNKLIAKNGLSACLTYLDFFTIHAQRKALTIAANSCSNISYENFQLIKEIFPTLENVVLSYTDCSVAENAWLAISRIIMSFKSRPDFLEELFMKDKVESQLFSRYAKVIINSCSRSNQGTSPLALTFNTCLSLIKSLIVLVSSSVKISKLFILSCDIGEMIIQALSRYSKPDSLQKEKLSQPEFLLGAPNAIAESEVPIEALMAAPKELILQLLNLICYLLPIRYPTRSTPFLHKGYVYNKSRREINKERIESYSSPDAKPKYVIFVNHVWSLLMNIYSCTVEYEVRRRVIISLMRIISFCETENDFKQINKFKSITSLLASIVIQNKHTIKKNVEDLEKKEINRKSEEKNVDKKEGLADGIESAFHDNNESEADEPLSGSAEVGENYDEHENIEDDDEEDDEEEEEGEEEEEEEEDDDDEEEGEDDAEGIETSRRDGFRFNAYSRCMPENVAALFTKLLLLGGFKLAQLLIDKSPGLIFSEFEREGLISDTNSILEVMKASNLFQDPKFVEEEIDESFETYDNEETPSSRYNTSYFDLELTKDYEFSLSLKGILDSLFVSASEIVHKYSLAKSTFIVDSSTHMSILSEATNTLNSPEILREYSFSNWCAFWEKLEKAAFKSDLSSFELISCGIIEALLNLFKSDVGVEGSDCYKAFTSVFFNFDQNEPSIASLIGKLQEALTRSESFEIISSGANITPFTNSSSNGIRTAAMVKQVKIKLMAESSVDESDIAIPDNLKQMMLSVHAIATFKTINTFLKSRIRILSQLTARIQESDRTFEGSDPFYFEFLINDEVIPNGTTIYGAIYKSLQSEPDQFVDPQSIWSTAHIVKFRKVTGAPSSEGDEGSKYTNESGENELSALNVSTTISIFHILKVLFNMNTSVRNTSADMKSVSESLFLNWKLTAKLNRQLEEPLVVASGTLPGWSIHITRQFPFIFPLDTRVFFLQSTSFGYSRLIHTWQVRTNQETNENVQNSNNQAPQLGRPTRHKVRISRNQMLQSAMKVLNLYGTHPCVLEFEYFNEVGTGLGPTLEFYANVSKEFARKKLKLWRDDDNSSNEYVTNKLGLFPAPLNKKKANDDNGRKILMIYNMLGKFVARGLLDSRIIDFQFNPLFFQLANSLIPSGDTNSSGPLPRSTMLKKLKLVDGDLARSLVHMTRYIDQFKEIPPEQRDQILVDGSTLEELSLTFSLPGYPDVELIPGGDDVAVKACNVESYVDQIIDMTIGSGVQRQILSFIDGFSKVFPYSSMIIFSPDEAVRLFGSGEEDWSYQTLLSSIHANHGYNSESESIHMLLKIMGNFNGEERRVFLQFLTGSPRLPIGGFKALRPELTVVRKISEDGLSDDDYLPSVMTCANYLKLPKYSSEEVMKQRLTQAIYEGAGAFLLS